MRWALAPFVALALLGLVALARRSPARAAWGALWLLLAPALVIVYLQYRQQFFALRYILFALPIYLVLISAGLISLAEWLGLTFTAGPGSRNGSPILSGTPSRFGKGLGVRSSAVLLVGVIGLGLLQFGEVRHDYTVPKDDWRRVGAFLTANVRPGDTLGAPDVQAFIRFYAPAQPAAIVDSSARGPHEEALANGERFWFVWSDYTLAPVDATRAWVSALPSVTIDLDPRIRVIFVHPGRTQAEMLAEAQGFAIPPPTLP